ncbi:MAG: DnaJ domain-containing protein [Bacteroidia bacterium]|nr:DnaJ domain-containing protein [Bacteroidia bacterium]
MPNYYQILGVDSSASKEDIKAAFKQMALRYHPDRNPNNPAAEEHFKQVNEAYHILSDDLKRFYYDQGLRNPISYTYPGSYTYYSPPVYARFEPYKNSYDPANYVSKSVQFKIKLFTGLFFVVFAVACVFFYHFMNRYTASTHFQAALEFVREGENKAALVKISYALEFNPYLYEAYMLRADINREDLHNYYRAMEDYDFIIQNIEHPDAELFYKRGLCSYYLYDFETAVEAFQQAIRLNAENGYYYHYLGLSLGRLDASDPLACKNLKKAESLGVEAEELFPDISCP